MSPCGRIPRVSSSAVGKPEPGNESDLTADITPDLVEARSLQ